MRLFVYRLTSIKVLSRRFTTIIILKEQLILILSRYSTLYIIMGVRGQL